MPKPRAGWERVAYMDSPGGATATTKLVHAVDVNINKTNEKSETTDRGDGTSVPKVTQQTVALVREITFSYRYWDADTVLADLIAATETGTPIAIKVERYNGQDTEFDGDCIMDYTSPGALKDNQLLEFTATPSQDLGRTWSDS